MNDWITVRKGGTHLHIAYGNTYTNNLLGYNTQIHEAPNFKIQLDLSPNLRGRNKQTNTYLDARELAGGEIAKLTLIQMDDERILEAIDQSLQRLPETPKIWTLTLNLEQVWPFDVEPEFRISHALHSLFLHVVEGSGQRQHGKPGNTGAGCGNSILKFSPFLISSALNNAFESPSSGGGSDAEP